MKLYLTMFDSGRGWQPMKLARSANLRRLCVYETYDNAIRGIRANKYKYGSGTEFKVVTFVED